MPTVPFGTGFPAAVTPLDGTEQLSLLQGGVMVDATTQDIADLGTGQPPQIVTESGTSLTADDTNSGNYTRFTNAGTKSYTFSDAETYLTGAEYHGRNVGAGDLTLIEGGGMTINPPAGGTLVIPQGGTFTVKIVAADEADLFGLTVAAP